MTHHRRTTKLEAAEGSACPPGSAEILDAVGDGLFTLDTEWRIVAANRAAQQVAGLSRAQLLGRDFREAWPEAAGTAVEDACCRAMVRRTGAGAELRRVQDDRVAWSEIRAWPVEGGIVVSHRDITARKQEEQRLRESEARFRLATEALQGAIYEYDAATGRAVREGAFLELVGLHPEEIPPTTEGWLDRIHPDDIGTMRAALATLYDGNANRLEVEYRVRHCDGRWVHCWQRSLAVRDAEGRLLRVVGSVMDVSARKTAEFALRESEARFRAFAEHAPDAIYIVDGPGRRLEYLNPAYERIWGEPRGVVLQDIGRWAELLHPGDRARGIAAMHRLYEDAEPVDTEYRILRADGEVRHIRDTAVPIRDADGNVHRVVGIAHDATARKLAETHRELLIRELNHRVKNTLATVQAIAAQTLRASDPVARKSFEDRLLALAGAHDLLTRGNWEGARLREVAEAALRPHMSGGRIALSGGELRLVPKAALAIGMALHELATNAGKYGALSLDAGRVSLDWWQEDDRLRLSWWETGGPTVKQPARRGFGTRLMERGLPHELGGALRLDFAPGGLRCEMEAPLSVLARG